MSQNLATYTLDADLMRNSEYTGTPFTDTESASYNARKGCNKAGSNAPYIGLATGVKSPSGATLAADDTAAHRSQHIGQTPDATTTLKAQQGADVNDTLAYVTPDGSTADGAEADVATGAVNRTGVTVTTTDKIWGVIPVA